VPTQRYPTEQPVVIHAVLMLLVVVITLETSLVTCAMHTMVGMLRPRSGKASATAVVLTSASLHTSVFTANGTVMLCMSDQSVPRTLECFPLLPAVDM